MNKALLAAPMTALLLAAGAAPAVAADTRTQPASSRPTSWGPWEPIPRSPAYTEESCGTTLRFSSPIQREEQQTRLDAGGNTLIRVRGPLNLRVEPTKPGTGLHPVTVDISGKSLGDDYSIAYKNGDFLFSYNGNNFLGFRPGQNRYTGFPRNVITHGSIKVLFKADRSLSADIIDRPRSFENLCHLMRS